MERKSFSGRERETGSLRCATGVMGGEERIWGPNRTRKTEYTTITSKK